MMTRKGNPSILSVGKDKKSGSTIIMFTVFVDVFSLTTGIDC